MNCTFLTPTAIFLVFDTVWMQFFILICRIVTPLANRTFKGDYITHLCYL